MKGSEWKWSKSLADPATKTKVRLKEVVYFVCDGSFVECDLIFSNNLLFIIIFYYLLFFEILMNPKKGKLFFINKSF